MKAQIIINMEKNIKSNCKKKFESAMIVVLNSEPKMLRSNIINHFKSIGMHGVDFYFDEYINGKYNNLDIGKFCKKMSMMSTKKDIIDVEMEIGRIYTSESRQARDAIKDLERCDKQSSLLLHFLKKGEKFNVMQNDFFEKNRLCGDIVLACESVIRLAAKRVAIKKIDKIML